MTTYSSVLEQYEKNKPSASGNKTKVSEEDRLKKYFTTVLPKGVQSATKTIRLLPANNGGSPFVEVNFHEVQVNGTWTKLYDPAQEGKPSPLNDIYHELMMSGDPGDRELAKSYRSRKFYIVKVIDRDNEKDGPKFWRFKHSTKMDGIFDKIVPLYNRGELHDPENGRDITLSLNLVKSGNGKEYTSITTIIPEDKSPLHSDSETMQMWLDDQTIWSDVYSKKSEEYLTLVANGEVPKWDSTLKKFVSSTTSMEDIVPSNTIYNTSVNIEEPQVEEVESDDDLPF